MGQLHLLITDYLLWFLVGLVLIYSVWAKGQYLHSSAWHKLVEAPIALSALISFCFFLIIGLLDSVHWLVVDPKSALVGKIYSCLDYLLDGSFLSEVSYSEPFADSLFSGVVANPNQINTLQHVKPLLGWYTWGWIIAKSLFISIILNSLFVLTMKTWLQQNRQSFVAILRQYNLPIFVFFFWCFSLSFAWQLVAHYHLFGTDQIGDDLFYQCLKSVRTGFVIGGVTMLFMLPFAVFFGLAAGFYGGVVDDCIQFVYTVLSAIPAVLLIAAAVLALQIFVSSHGDLFATSIARADFKLLGLCVILGVTGWTPLARLLRAEVLKLKSSAFIDAARLMRVSKIKILFRHLLPNVMHLILMTVVLDFSGLVLAEAVLSYVGVGVDASTYSWGNIINAARLELARDPVVWWPICAAFFMMFLLVLAINLLADELRYQFDPKSY